MRKLIVWVIILCFISITGCGSATDNTIKIEEIDKDPGKYFDQECVLQGYVSKVVDVPMLQHDLFKISDGSGEIWIYTERGVPPKRVKVKVKGILRGLLQIPVLNIEAKYYIELQEMEYL
ncbi:MAG: hypothetical protein JSV88_18760 [Candidatus Aminicenantes bacterium]|nr:MAG: hypothetical protein JSV88_18760 [Candidatus Aminicenantes bacterium]